MEDLEVIKFTEWVGNLYDNYSGRWYLKGTVHMNKYYTTAELLEIFRGIKK